jgi:hypothetical protein
VEQPEPVGSHVRRSGSVLARHANCPHQLMWGAHFEHSEKLENTTSNAFTEIEVWKIG